MKRIAVLAAVVAFGIARPVFARPAKPPVRLLVYSLSSSERWSPLAKDLSEGIVAHVAGPAARKGITALSEADVALMSTYVKERADLSEEECRKAEVCLSRISQSANADKLMFGRVDRLGDSFVGVLNLLDATKGEREATRSCVAGDEAEFRAQMIETASAMLGLSASSSVAAQAPVPSFGQKIAVVPITGLEEQPGVAETLSDLLGLEIVRFEYSVLTRSELILLLRDAKERRALDANERSFDDILIPLAGAYGADYLATGHIARFDQSYVLVLKLIQISEAKVINRLAEVYRGPIDYLPSAMRYATMKLFGREMSGTGDLSIVTEVKGEYRIDRGGAEVLPQNAPDLGLTAAKHEVSISAPGYLSYSADVYIEGGAAQPLAFRPALEPAPREWYESPLVWSIAGIAAAGAATAIIFVLVPKGADSGGRLEP